MLDDQSDSQSEGGASSASGGSRLSLTAPPPNRSKQDNNNNNNNNADREGMTGSSMELDKTVELENNSKLNKNTQVLSEAEKEIIALVESGKERLHALAMHHKKVITELRQQQRHLLSQKNKEHRRKTSELLKDHEEELEQLKMDQAASMKELLDTQLQSEETRADTAISQNLLGMMLPAHILEKLENGLQPEPENFNCVTLFFTDIFNFKKLVGTIPPTKILSLLNVLYSKFDDVIAKYPQLYKVESVSDTYMVVAGVSYPHEKTPQEITECAAQALKCCLELQQLVESLDLADIVGEYPIKLRIGVHSGTINAGLIGTKMSRYCLFGDTVNTASRMCTTGDASRIQVSSQTIQVLGDDDQFEFEVRGEIEVKGKGKMNTFWLLE